MAGRRVERIEAVELRLHFRAVGDGEADLAQDAAHFLAHQRERVVGAGAAVRRRQRRVDGRSQLGADLRLLNGSQRGVEEGLQLGLGLVDKLAERGAPVLGHRAHLFHEPGELAVGTDEAGLGGLKFRAEAEDREFGTGPGH